MSKFDEILKKAKNGSLPPELLNWAVGKLQDPSVWIVDKTTILRAVAVAEATQYTKEIEALLDDKEDNILSRLSLTILFRWHSDGRYNWYILEKMSLAQNEEEEYDGLQHTAISLAGEWLRSHDSASFMQALFLLFENSDLDTTTRGEAYLAITRAMGSEWNQIPFIGREFDLKNDVDPLLLLNAKTRLTRLTRLTNMT